MDVCDWSGEKRGLAVNLASRSGVVNKLNVTAEMSTTKHSDTGAIGGERGRSKGGKGSGVSKNGWGEGWLFASKWPHGCYFV